MKQELIQNSYLGVPGFIPSTRAHELANLFEAHLQASGAAPDPQCPLSPAMYNFMPFVALLVEKTPHVSELIGEPVLPTYAYARSYKRGDTLLRHRDRPACEISLTLNLKTTVAWPVYIEKPNKDVACLDQSPGDAMLYLGCEADHWRDVYQGDNHVQVFLHYVRANGPKAWAYFDREQQQAPTAPTGRLPVVWL